MEFVSKDADMVLVKTTPEELKKLAAIIRGVHGYDFVLCEMDPDEAMALAQRLEKADGDSWVFHELEIFYLCLLLQTAFGGIGLERLSRHLPFPLTQEEIEKQLNAMDAVNDLARKA